MKTKASLSVIFLTVFIDLMGFGILIPILPTFAGKELGISDFAIGIIVAIFSFNQFVFNPILGKWSDKIGRRPIILVTLVITSSSYLIFSFANSFLVLFLARFLAGIGGSNIGVAQAYISDVTKKNERSKGMGMIGAAFGLGFVFGPMVGGYLSKFGYSVAGYGAAGFSFLALIFAYIFLPESIKNKTDNRKTKMRIFDLKSINMVLKTDVVGLLVILFFIIVFSMANIYGTFSIIGYKIYEFSDQEIGYLFGVIGIVGAIMQGGAIRFLSEKFKDRTLLVYGMIFMSLGLTGIPYGQTFYGVGIVVSVLAIGTGLLQPTILSMISKFSPDDKQGEIMGINQSISSLARVIGPIWGGFAFDFIGYQFPFLTGGVFTFIALIITYFYLRKGTI